LKKLKSYFLVLFPPRNCCNNSFYRQFHSLGASHDRLASRGTCTPSGYPVLNPVNYMGVLFFILVSVPVETMHKPPHHPSVDSRYPLTSLFSAPFMWS
jgi:hypothetical protein